MGTIRQLWYLYNSVFGEGHTPLKPTHSPPRVPPHRCLLPILSGTWWILVEFWKCWVQTSFNSNLSRPQEPSTSDPCP